MLPGLTAEEHKRLILSVGTHRGKRLISPVEAAVLFAKAQAAGASLAECAKTVQLDGPTWVGRFLSLLKLPEDVRHLVDWGRAAGAVTFTAAAEIARLDSGDDQRGALQTALAHDLSSAEVRQLVQLRRRSRHTIEECAAAVLKMRPRIEVKHVFVGSVTPGLRARLGGLGQYERDHLFAGAARKVVGSVRVGGRLGAERFTLVGGKDFGEVIAAKKNVLEAEINEALATGLGGA